MLLESIRHVQPRRFLPVLLALCLAIVPAARAQEVLTEVSAKRMTKILTSMGFEVKEGERSGDDPTLKFQLAGYNVLLLFANKNTDAQLYIGFGDQQVSTDKVNEWNRKHRFARAYRDDDGNPVLESDIDFTGGVTEANIKAWVTLYRNLLNQYVKFL
jgi:hypothetical protein